MGRIYYDDCDSCRALQGLISLTPSPPILETAHWIVVHAHPTSVQGWLVVVLKRHYSSLHQLSKDEFMSLADVLRHLCRGLHAVLGAEKEYIALFAESQKFRHVHFHVIARLPDWPASLVGPGVFAALGDDVKHPLSRETVIALAIRIKDHLTRA